MGTENYSRLYYVKKGGGNMQNIKIYLAGAMSGIPYKEQLAWRDQLIYCVKYSGLDFTKSISFFSPPD